jgi:hypothetical protein
MQQSAASVVVDVANDASFRVSGLAGGTVEAAEVEHRHLDAHSRARLEARRASDV